MISLETWLTSIRRQSLPFSHHLFKGLTGKPIELTRSAQVIIDGIITSGVIVEVTCISNLYGTSAYSYQFVVKIDEGLLPIDGSALVSVEGVVMPEGWLTQVWFYNGAPGGIL